MKYAVISDRGRQYKVSEGQELYVDRIEGVNGNLELDQVLLYVDGDTVKVGEPNVTGAKVVCKVTGEEKGDKVDVFTYKSKSRYRRHRGFRPVYTKVQVEKINPGK